MAQPTVTTTLLHAAPSPARVLVVGAGLGTGAVSYTHLTLPTNREV